ncbi:MULTISPECIES: hypothetical protein [Treponema]|uniref:hypothetical protein n=1 Tax=Treponema TaxID=157 RepID=UPI001961E599|nr:hypothetical protein [Treponema sp. Marseille-Q4523]MBM7023065.1 hypothetical protein [Treponema sp. Marseille-Q4523]
MDEQELDPSIAALLAEAERSHRIGETNIDTAEADVSPETQTDSPAERRAPKGIHDVDLGVKAFGPPGKSLNDVPSDVFDDPEYYKTALSGENESAQRVHVQLSKYLTSQDPKDRSVFRQNIISAYWELLRGMSEKSGNMHLPMPKRMLMRFGVLLPSLFKPEQKDFFSRIIFENLTNEPILYMDEWFKEVLSGRMNISMTDEPASSRKISKNPDEAQMQEQTRLMQLQSKNSGKLQSAESMLTMKEHEREMLEIELKRLVNDICEHQPCFGLEPHLAPYTESQKHEFSEISDKLRNLSRNDKELAKNLREFEEAKGIFDSVQEKLDAGPEIVEMNTGDLKTEFDTVRQMAKMTVGRQGNQFPIFTREFFHCTERGTGTRENVLEVMRWIESIDPGAFCRIHKSVPNRIIPYTLLVPTYGDRGFCWQPFDRYNLVTSRGRIVIPMYPRDLHIAVLTAVADLRWQVAKEKASYYWMEEGLTGQYYQYIDRQKLKGDLKQFFIEDYILWMTKESTGVQRLDKEVRGIFWRNMPFPQALKEELRKRSLVYDELCIKDNNRAMSDGY